MESNIDILSIVTLFMKKIATKVLLSLIAPAIEDGVPINVEIKLKNYCLRNIVVFMLYGIPIVFGKRDRHEY